MAGAIRMQVHSRGIAAIAVALILAGGVLAMRHQASTSHVRDRAGGFFHAGALSGHHSGDDSDIHDQHNAEADAGECALLSAFHQAASASITRPTVAAAHLPALGVADTRDGARRAHRRQVYRIAPKTSPPAAA